ncbi:MAG TPA: hypothetical protein PKK15_03140, partial [Kouleothrix sp.]|nr:hypothetical protein [Kouleothrix sp.]
VLLARVLPGGALLRLVLAGGAGAAIYFGVCVLLRVEALDFFIAVLVRRLRRARSPEPPPENPASG